MLKKLINFKDYDGTDQKDTWYFNLTETELLEIQSAIKGGLVERMNRAIKEDDSQTIMNLIKMVILKSVGEKTADGKYFVKFKIIDGVKVSIADLFEPTPAYSALFTELLTTDNGATEFMRGIIPFDIAKELPANTMDALPDELKESLPEEVKDALASQNQQ